VFIELPRAEVEGFWEKFGSTNGPAPGGSARTATLTQAQAAAQLDRWKSMGGTNILSQFRITTLSGRQALVSLGHGERMAPDVRKGQTKPELMPPALEITPRLTGDGPGVKLDLKATLWEFPDYGASEPFPAEGWADREVKQQHERLENFLASNNVVLLAEQGSSAGAEAAKRNKQLASLRTERKLLEVFTPEQLAQFGGKSHTAAADGSSFGQGAAGELNPTLAGPLDDFIRASQQLRSLRAKREEVLEFLEPSHPKIMKLDHEIAEQARLLEVFKRETLAQVANRRAALALQITNLEASAREWEQKGLDASRKMAEYEGLKQDVKRAQDNAFLPLPHLRIRQVTASVNVYDGQTVVLGHLAGEGGNKLKAQAPILGDLPVVGRLFRNEIGEIEKTDLLILVTPTIVDPAGNRIHPQNQ